MGRPTSNTSAWLAQVAVLHTLRPPSPSSQGMINNGQLLQNGIPLFGSFPVGVVAPCRDAGKQNWAVWPRAAPRDHARRGGQKPRCGRRSRLDISSGRCRQHPDVGDVVRLASWPDIGPSGGPGDAVVGPAVSNRNLDGTRSTPDPHQSDTASLLPEVASRRTYPAQKGA
jgi:hypothetical protein